MNSVNLNLKVPDVLYKGGVDVEVNIGVVVSGEELGGDITKLKKRGERLNMKEAVHISYTSLHTELYFQSTTLYLDSAVA